MERGGGRKYVDLDQALLAVVPLWEAEVSIRAGQARLAASARNTLLYMSTSRPWNRTDLFVIPARRTVVLTGPATERTTAHGDAPTALLSRISQGVGLWRTSAHPYSFPPKAIERQLWP